MKSSRIAYYSIGFPPICLDECGDPRCSPLVDAVPHARLSAIFQSMRGAPIVCLTGLDYDDARTVKGWLGDAYDVTVGAPECGIVGADDRPTGPCYMIAVAHSLGWTFHLTTCVRLPACVPGGEPSSSIRGMMVSQYKSDDASLTLGVFHLERHNIVLRAHQEAIVAEWMNAVPADDLVFVAGDTNWFPDRCGEEAAMRMRMVLDERYVEVIGSARLLGEPGVYVGHNHEDLPTGQQLDRLWVSGMHVSMVAGLNAVAVVDRFGEFRSARIVDITAPGASGDVAVRAAREGRNYINDHNGCLVCLREAAK
jgi:hypothetical protein